MLAIYLLPSNSDTEGTNSRAPQKWLQSHGDTGKVRNGENLFRATHVILLVLITEVGALV